MILAPRPSLLKTRPAPAARSAPAPRARKRAFSAARRTRGFSILEVVVSMAILVTGMAAIAAFFPMSLQQNQRAADVSTAAFLAQMLAEEIRKDDSRNRDLIKAIQKLESPTAPVTFPLDSRFAYSFSGVSALVPQDDPADPRDDHGVARIIVRYAADFNSNQDILYELRFDE